MRLPFGARPFGRSRTRSRSGAVLTWLPTLLCGAGFAAAAFLLGGRVAEPQVREVTIRMKQYEYDPPVLQVNRGDTVRLRFAAEDVVHGFYLEGYGLQVHAAPQRAEVELRRTGEAAGREVVEEVVFEADREGKFRYRCSTTCGYLHPFMQGELIVGPNRLLHSGLGAGLGLLVAGSISAGRRRRRS